MHTENMLDEVTAGDSVKDNVIRFDSLGFLGGDFGHTTRAVALLHSGMDQDSRY